MNYFIKIITFISLIFFILTSHSYAEWIKYLSTEIGDDFYINTKSIETKGKFVFYQSLSNYTKKPLKSGTRSFISTIKVDCELLRYKFVNTKAFNKLWGEELKKENNKEDKEWSNLQSNDAREIALRAVCNKFD